ncbi:NADH-quinone oxidoreductase subunit NuoH [Anaerolinea thermophila]|uniref:NADH-quinone oxidoreductase subunit H n=1 Tax=Anaerolinea thermophila (strain DSM 14523 / JCM 11388 / NBRC 100420 / UNI-1) TaxID=926569 RepID=E8N3R2_ANATU|nr:NADH-quinone oxidoreductase subunit NuoH [Anaerolinea thermophila]BAJ63076.1 NADH-quinone oxidoreductase chain H [Anaerolinea thermophila UNI-1]
MSNWLENPIQWIAEWLRSVLIGWGILPSVVDVILMFLGAAILATVALLWVLFLIWFERKLIGRIQDRFGPNRVGPWGIFQSIADMIKIFTKEYITPQGADKVIYNLAPIVAVASVLLIWAILPFTMSIMGVNLNVGVVYVIAVGGFGVLAILMAGYASNNKYAFLGASRSVAQLISYEVPMVVSLLIPVLLAGSMGLNDIVKAQSVPYLVAAPIAALVFFVTSMAETGRAPFDLVEAESELVAGYNTEYSGLKFGMFFVGEFLHSFTAALLFAVLFLGGWRGPFVDQVPLLGLVYLFIKTFVMYYLIILVRGSLPRFRIDQMMDLNWKVLTPLSILSFLVTAIVAKVLEGQFLFQVVGLLVVNLLLLFLFMEWGERRTKRRRRPMVSEPRPLATPVASDETSAAQS